MLVCRPVLRTPRRYTSTFHGNVDHFGECFVRTSIDSNICLFGKDSLVFGKEQLVCSKGTCVSRKEYVLGKKDMCFSEKLCVPQRSACFWKTYFVFFDNKYFVFRRSVVFLKEVLCFSTQMCGFVSKCCVCHNHLTFVSRLGA